MKENKHFNCKLLLLYTIDKKLNLMFKSVAGKEGVVVGFNSVVSKSKAEITIKTN